MRAVDHYAEAERLAEPEARMTDEIGAYSFDTDADRLAAGQLHATLALAGATALQAYTDGSDDELEDWAKAAGEGE